MASEAISEHLICKIFLGEYTPRPPWHVHAYAHTQSVHPPISNGRGFVHTSRSMEVMCRKKIMSEFQYKQLQGAVRKSVALTLLIIGCRVRSVVRLKLLVGQMVKGKG